MEIYNIVNENGNVLFSFKENRQALWMLYELNKRYPKSNNHITCHEVFEFKDSLHFTKWICEIFKD